MGKLTKIWLKEISKSIGTNNFFLSNKFPFLLSGLLISFNNNQFVWLGTFYLLIHNLFLRSLFLKFPFVIDSRTVVWYFYFIGKCIDKYIYSYLKVNWSLFVILDTWVMNILIHILYSFSRLICLIIINLKRDTTNTFLLMIFCRDHL